MSWSSSGPEGLFQPQGLKSLQGTEQEQLKMCHWEPQNTTNCWAGSQKPSSATAWHCTSLPSAVGPRVVTGLPRGCLCMCAPSPLSR